MYNILVLLEKRERFIYLKNRGMARKKWKKNTVEFYVQYVLGTSKYVIKYCNIKASDEFINRLSEKNFELTNMFLLNL